MGLRPGRTTRRLERPYTRVSRKKPRKSYVVGVPFSKIHIFEMGNPTKKYDTCLHLVVGHPVQIRDNALEAARIVSNKLLERKILDNYFFKILVFPHHVLREHSMATGAGADRFSSGMRHAFGKPAGRAARLMYGQKIMTLKLDKKNLDIGRMALKRATKKLPVHCRIEIE
jgi:large subunit ribosomal protein L10e